MESQKKHLAPALVASVLLHAGLVLAVVVLRVPDKASIAETEIQPAPIAVNVVNVNPQRAAAARRAAAALANALALDRSAPAAAETPPPQTRAMPDTPLRDATERPLPAATDANETSEATADSASDTSTSIDTVALQQSITDYAASLQSTHLRNFVNECQRYRNRYEVQDCPPGEEAITEQQAAIEANLDETFTDLVTGYDRNKRIVKELETEGKELHAMMEQGGALGQIASERYYLKKSQFSRLDTSNKAGTLPILKLNLFGGRASLLAGLITIDIKGKIRFLDKQANGPAARFEEPEYKPHSGAATAEPEFTVAPPLFENKND